MRDYPLLLSSSLLIMTSEFLLSEFLRLKIQTKNNLETFTKGKTASSPVLSSYIINQIYDIYQYCKQIPSIYMYSLCCTIQES